MQLHVYWLPIQINIKLKVFLWVAAGDGGTRGRLWIPPGELYTEHSRFSNKVKYFYIIQRRPAVAEPTTVISGCWWPSSAYSPPGTITCGSAKVDHVCINSISSFKYLCIALWVAIYMSSRIKFGSHTTLKKIHREMVLGAVAATQRSPCRDCRQYSRDKVAAAFIYSRQRLTAICIMRHTTIQQLKPSPPLKITLSC